jgi:altronate dehydratase
MNDDRFTHLAAAIDACSEGQARMLGEVATEKARQILDAKPNDRYAHLLHQLGCLLLDHADAQARVLRELSADENVGSIGYDRDDHGEDFPPAA